MRAIDPPSNDVMLHEALQSCDGLIVLLGDVIEMYDAGRDKRRHFNRIGRTYPRTFSFIEENPDRVRLINGNHDDGCLGFFRHHTPVNMLYHDGWVFLHGHQADRFFESKTAEVVSEFFCKAAHRWECLTGYDYTSAMVDKQRKARLGAAVQERYAREFLLNSGGIKGIVMGHTHCATTREWGDQIYVNAGTWLDGKNAYQTLNP
jgi:UDP-2,3-diacylglucosamine pyrophosphatase LpxH